MAGQIKVIDANVIQEMVAELGESCENFWNDMCNQMSSLKAAQGEIISGVGNMAQAVDRKLNLNGERNNKPEQFPTSMYEELRKITQLLTQSRQEAQNGLVWIGRKLKDRANTLKMER